MVKTITLGKRGKLGTNTLNTAILAIVMMVLIFKLYAALVPEAQAAGDDLNASGVPLGSLFTSGGVIFIILMAGLLLVIVRSVMGSNMSK